MSGWQSCTACAGGGKNAVYSFQQNLATQSLDGGSLLQSIHGGTPFSHVLSFKNLGTTSSAIHHFIQDVYLLLDKPANANGFSVAGHQSIGGRHYRFSTQCSFNKGIWSVWDTKNGRWLATSLACTRPAALTWRHLIIETERTSDNREHFISITQDGVKHYLNVYVYPEYSSANSTGVHLEIDGNATESPYTGYWDKFTFTTFESSAPIQGWVLSSVARR